jgi:hypothetical protein
MKMKKKGLMEQQYDLIHGLSQNIKSCFHFAGMFQKSLSKKNIFEQHIDMQRPNNSAKRTLFSTH